MSSKLMKHLCVWFGVGLFILSVSAQVWADGSFSIQWGKGSDSENQQTVNKVKKGGPPDHAPAYGYRAKHQYRYYPEKSVYYESARRLYFYLKGENWEIGASLPTGLKADLGDYVSIELDTDKPYLHYSEHVKQYPPGKSKSNKTQKWVKKSKK